MPAAGGAQPRAGLVVRRARGRGYSPHHPWSKLRRSRRESSSERGVKPRLRRSWVRHGSWPKDRCRRTRSTGPDASLTGAGPGAQDLRGSVARSTCLAHNQKIVRSNRTPAPTRFARTRRLMSGRFDRGSVDGLTRNFVAGVRTSRHWFSGQCWHGAAADKQEERFNSATGAPGS